MVVSKLVYGEQIIGFRFSRIPFKKVFLQICIMMLAKRF